MSCQDDCAQLTLESGGPPAWVPRPPGHCIRVLGVTISAAPAREAICFSVPAHVFATLNVVLKGTLSRDRHALPGSFATGCHTRSRRYVLSAGAVLLTLFCRADALSALSGKSAAHFTDAWLPADRVFKAWAAHPLRDADAADPLAMAQALLDCVAPIHLPPLRDVATDDSQPAARLHAALDALTDHALETVAAQLRMSERGLQRLFLTQWGINPKRVQRMLRIQRAVALWDARCDGNLADLALRLGLADQAHLAREFRQLAGYPPGRLKDSPRVALGHPIADTLWALRAGSTLLPLLMR